MRVGGRDRFGSLAVMVAAGAVHSAIVTSDGAVWTWGKGSKGRLGHGDTQKRWTPMRIEKEVFAGSPAVMVACGHSHTLVMTAVGGVWGCGEGAHGRLGNGDTQNRLVLTQVGVHFKKVQIVMIPAGSLHSLGVSLEGDLWCWGCGLDGRLGRNDNLQDQLVPTKLEFFGRVQMVSAGAGICMLNILLLLLHNK